MCVILKCAKLMQVKFSESCECRRRFSKLSPQTKFLTNVWPKFQRSFVHVGAELCRDGRKWHKTEISTFKEMSHELLFALNDVGIEGSGCGKGTFAWKKRKLATAKDEIW